ncbi:hypothetical protein [Marinobacter sp. GH_1]|uniref:hypothetical protein n=1 Tax=Marinobacter sp. GH_1 TaxID=3402164 RepID=UPI003B43C669
MNLKKYLVFGLSLFMLPFAHADVMGVFESSARPTEMHVYYRDERHFKLEFVPKGASKPVSYLVASDGNAFLVSSRGGQKLAVDFSDRIQADAECAGSVKFSSQEKQETFAGLEGTAFTVTVKSKKLPDPMVLAKNELAGKVTKAYFHALSTLSNPDFS